MAILPITNQSIEDNFNNAAKFTIETNAVAFKVLSSSLYERPIVAIVRELLSNAFDSHIAANNTTTPVKIHVPTLEETYFSITDYGTSLSEEEVYSVYTTFFSSTKRDNNDQTGCFGLGSKTPFAYSDTFTVTAVKDNIETYYVIYFKDNVPTITKISQKHIEASNSFTVTLSVKTLDIRLFKEAIEEVLKYNTKPIETNISINTFVQDAIIKNDSMILCNPNNYSCRKEFIVKFNDINYYDITELIKDIKQSLPNDIKDDLDKKFGFIDEYFSGYTLIKDIPVGSISLTPNREEVIDNNENREFLKTVYLESMEEVFNTLLYYIKDILTPYMSNNIINKILPTNLIGINTQVKPIADLDLHNHRISLVINRLLAQYLHKELTSDKTPNYFSLGICDYKAQPQQFTFKLPTYHSYLFGHLEGFDVLFNHNLNVNIDLADIPKTDFVYISKSTFPTQKTYEIIETLKENNNNKNKTIYVTCGYSIERTKEAVTKISKYLSLLHGIVKDEQDIKVYTLEEYILRYEPKFENIAQLSRLYKRKGVKKDSIDYDNKTIHNHIYGLGWNPLKQNVKLKEFKDEHKYYATTKLGAKNLLTVLNAIQVYYNDLLKTGVWNNNLINELTAYFKANGYDLKEISNKASLFTTAVESKASVELIKKYAEKSPLSFDAIIKIILNNTPKAIAVESSELNRYMVDYSVLKSRYNNLDENSKIIVNKLFNLKQKIDFLGKITVKCMDGYLIRKLFGINCSSSFRDVMFCTPTTKRKLFNFCDGVEKYFKLIRKESTKISKRLVLNTIRKNNNRRISYAKTILSSYDK